MSVIRGKTDTKQAENGSRTRPDHGRGLYVTYRNRTRRTVSRLAIFLYKETVILDLRENRHRRVCFQEELPWKRDIGVGTF